MEWIGFGFDLDLIWIEIGVFKNFKECARLPCNGNHFSSLFPFLNLSCCVFPIYLLFLFVFHSKLCKEQGSGVAEPWPTGVWDMTSHLLFWSLCYNLRFDDKHSCYLYYIFYYGVYCQRLCQIELGHC